MWIVITKTILTWIIFIQKKNKKFSKISGKGVFGIMIEKKIVFWGTGNVAKSL